MAKVYLVTGGCGFLGRWIVEKLLERGEKEVKVFDLRQTFKDDRVEFILGDLTNLEQVKKALKGVTTVIHTASPVHGNNEAIYFKVNVTGTNNVLEACHENKVKQLIFTSSSSVVFNGKDIHNGNEDLPYCKPHMDSYNKTKELAERSVLAANGNKGLMTISLRPSGLFGPRDVQAWPPMIEAGKEGKSKFTIGNGRNLCDWTYIENAAYAHLLAADKLTPGSPIGGQAYFITNGEPTPFEEMTTYVWKNLGYPTPKYHLPFLIMLIVAYITEFILFVLSPLVKIHPTLTVFRVRMVVATRYFSIEKAKKELGYQPQVSLQEGKERTLKWFKEQQGKDKQ